MDGQAKQRLIGSVVLIVMAVIIIPFLVRKPQTENQGSLESMKEKEIALTSPGEDASSEKEPPPDALPQDASYGQRWIKNTQDLNSRVDDSLIVGEEETETSINRTSATDASVSESNSAMKQVADKESPTGADDSSQTVATKVEKKGNEPKVRVMPLPEVQGATGSWMVQAGSFTRREYAVAMQERLAEHDFRTVIEPSHVKGKQWFRVRLGPYETRSNADEAAQTIQKMTGQKAYSLKGS